MKTSVEEVKRKVELEHREALNLLCANYDLWKMKDAFISMLAQSYVSGALDMEESMKEALCPGR